MGGAAAGAPAGAPPTEVPPVAGAAGVVVSAGGVTAVPAAESPSPLALTPARAVCGPTAEPAWKVAAGGAVEMPAVAGGVVEMLVGAGTPGIDGGATPVTLGIGE